MVTGIKFAHHRNERNLYKLQSSLRFELEVATCSYLQGQRPPCTLTLRFDNAPTRYQYVSVFASSQLPSETATNERPPGTLK